MRPVLFTWMTSMDILHENKSKNSLLIGDNL